MNKTTLLRACAHYEFDKRLTTAEAARNICNTYGVDVMSLSNRQKWFARFREGGRDLQDRPREGHPKNFGS